MRRQPNACRTSLQKAPVYHRDAPILDTPSALVYAAPLLNDWVLVLLSLCCVTDDKPGHKSQVDGLLKALSERRETRTQWLNIHQPNRLTAPVDLTICAGRLTHIPALKTRWRYGGQVVCLSKSWIPRWLFDLNVLPRHDGVPERNNVWLTAGSMNAIEASSQSDPNRGLILIGGPSANHGWDQASILEQLRLLVARTPNVHWTVTTSRRTPAQFAALLNDSVSLTGDTMSQIELVPFECTDRQWLLQQYANCGNIWVTEDSVSMVCESLSCGAVVGVFEVPRLKQGRVSGNLDSWIADGHVITLHTLQTAGLPTTPKHPPLQEASRIAERLLNWIDKQNLT